MKSKPHSTGFSLPVLLSFNELGWISLFMMGLICVSSWLMASQARRERDVANDKLRTLGTNSVNALEMARTNWVSLSNRLAQIEAKRQEIPKELEKASRQAAQVLKENLEMRQLLAASQAQIDELARQRKDQTNRIADLQRENDKLGQTNRLLEENKRFLEETNRFLEAKLAIMTHSGASRTESVVRQELLGLKGGLTNVVILLDRSASMQIGNRWESALVLVETWLHYLPIQRCALITFNDAYEQHPENGMLEVGGPDVSLQTAQTNRSRLIQPLYSLEPEGNTDTLAALRRAYDYPEVDTIILFTDGAPYRPATLSAPGRKSALELAGSGGRIRRSPELCDRILQEAKPHIPINTVGIGNYYEQKELTDFLLKLSRLTGGVFLGR